MSAHARTPVETLTDDEAAKLRALVAAEGGPRAAAKALNLNPTTLAHAACGWPVHRSTAIIVRARLAAA